MERRSVFWSLLALALIGLLASCAPPVPPPEGPTAETLPTLNPVSLGTGERLRAVATTSIVGDVVARVGGDAIHLTVLLPPGADPHTYEPTPADLTAVAQAHVLFVNGLGLEAFLERMLHNVGNGRPVVPLSAGIQPRIEKEHAEEEQEGEHAHGPVDPHVWLNVQNVLVWVENVQVALSRLDPARAETYAANAAAYRRELEALDAWIQEQVARIPPERRKLVVSHPVLGYFADRYGFEQVAAIYPISPGAEPSAQEIARLEETIRALQVPAIFAETTVSQALARRIAQDTGARVVVLYTDSLGEPGSGAESYVAMMRYNVTLIVEALKVQ
ncbi:MAG: metal ABC transporter substrate-binding protein [Anaerolineae bacterium]|nr:metal ABC transporter substrate-binding protein [Anaerolineae bacterium]MCX8068348.1 metal ABC transporter substrate-binding protein [Anaerolineae bacterium]MDW7991479.1 metal ABC transporter substrate-binding protein [Anaerolineae bacterium]